MSLEGLSLGYPSASVNADQLIKNRLLLIDPFALRRRSLELMFRLHGPDFSVKSVGVITEVQSIDADVVLCAVSGLERDLDATITQLQNIRHACGSTPLAAYTDVASVDLARELLRADINGVICMSMEIELAIAAVRLIYAGGTFLARDVLLNEEPSTFNRPGFEGLTHREAQIYELVRLGKPNKIIAHALGISVNTVKVHLYRLMRKLGASNRTEVALCSNPHHGRTLTQN